MNADELRMVGRDHWQMLIAEAEVARRVQRPQAARSNFRPRLARALVNLAGRLDPAITSQRRVTTSL